MSCLVNVLLNNSKVLKGGFQITKILSIKGNYFQIPKSFSSMFSMFPMLFPLMIFCKFGHSLSQKKKKSLTTNVLILIFFLKLKLKNKKS